VHGVNGLWGNPVARLLADGTYGDGWNGVNGTGAGLLYGDASQFAAQLIGGAATSWGWVSWRSSPTRSQRCCRRTVCRRTLKSSDSTAGDGRPAIRHARIGSAVILSETAPHGAGHLEPDRRRPMKTHHCGRPPRAAAAGQGGAVPRRRHGITVSRVTGHGGELECRSTTGPHRVLEFREKVRARDGGFGAVREPTIKAIIMSARPVRWVTGKSSSAARADRSIRTAKWTPPPVTP